MKMAAQISMFKRFLLLSISLNILLQAGTIHAQTDALLNQDAQPILKSRYMGIEGSPYYFPDWVTGSVLLMNGKVVEHVSMNYNGFTHEIEYRSGETVYILDKRSHLKVDILRDQNPGQAKQFPVSQLTFIRGFHRDLGDRYAAVLYLGEQLALIKDFHVGKSEQDFNDMSRSEMNAFKERSSYYVRRAGVLTVLKPQKKRILEAFENDARIGDFLTLEKLDLNSEQDLVRLVIFAETLGSK